MLDIFSKENITLKVNFIMITLIETERNMKHIKGTVQEKFKGVKPKT